MLCLHRDAGNQNPHFPPSGGSESFNRPDANSANFDGCQCVPSGPEVDFDNPNTDCTTDTATSPNRCWGTLVCPDADQSLKCHDQGEKCRGEGGGNPGFGYAPEGTLCIYDGGSENFKWVVATACRAELVVRLVLIRVSCRNLQRHPEAQLRANYSVLTCVCVCACVSCPYLSFRRTGSAASR